MARNSNSIETKTNIPNFWKSVSSKYKNPGQVAELFDSLSLMLIKSCHQESERRRRRLVFFRVWPTRVQTHCHYTTNYKKNQRENDNVFHSWLSVCVLPGVVRRWLWKSILYSENEEKNRKFKSF